MIAQAEDILFTARRQPSEVAILYPRSSEMWDGWVSSMQLRLSFVHGSGPKPSVC